jgi:hypothetical protein
MNNNNYCFEHNEIPTLKINCNLCHTQIQEFFDPTEMCLEHNILKSQCYTCGNVKSLCTHGFKIGMPCQFCSVSKPFMDKDRKDPPFYPYKSPFEDFSKRPNFFGKPEYYKQ